MASLSSKKSSLIDYVVGVQGGGLAEQAWARLLEWLCWEVLCHSVQQQGSGMFAFGRWNCQSWQHHSSIHFRQRSCMQTSRYQSLVWSSSWNAWLVLETLGTSLPLFSTWRASSSLPSSGLVIGTKGLPVCRWYQLQELRFISNYGSKWPSTGNNS